MKPAKIVDLSFVMYNCMPAWPTQPNLLYEQTGNVARDSATMHVVKQMTTHTGTHVDTPLHFVVGGKSVDQFPIEAFAGEGLVIDLSYKRPSEEITSDELKRFDDRILKDDVLMLYTGWDKRIGFNPEYLFEWPYLDEDCAKYLVKKSVKTLGVDTLSVSGWDGETPGHGPVARKGAPARTHRILLSSGMILVEVLRNLDIVLGGLKTRRAYFIYAPIALKGAEGGPCRALALLYD